MEKVKFLNRFNFKEIEEEKDFLKKLSYAKIPIPQYILKTIYSINLGFYGRD